MLAIRQMTQTLPAMEDASSRLFRGVLVGGTVGALVSWAAFSSKREGVPGGGSGQGDGLKEDALGLLHEYPNLCRDSNLYVALQEPVLLFLQLDQESTRQFLRNLEQLASLFLVIRDGSTKPGDIAVALKRRREASNRLHALLRKARQKKPLAASELDEDVEVIRKSMEGYIHNSMQQSNLNIMERCCPE